MNKTFEKIYSENNAILNKDEALNENTALFEKVYAEAEMLNEMNPKLRALLAAGLIGTAGLGATSCSTPEDPYEDPAPIEQPAPVTEAKKELNTLLKIIDNGSLREGIKGAKDISDKFKVVTDIASAGGTTVLLTKDGISINKKDRLGEAAYTFAKGSTFYFVLKADFPDLDPEDFLAAL